MTNRPITNEDMMKEARREVGFRRWVYPKKVASGDMTQEEAERRVSVMLAIEEHFAQLAAAERAKGDLFGGAA